MIEIFVPILTTAKKLVSRLLCLPKTPSPTLQALFRLLWSYLTGGKMFIYKCGNHHLQWIVELVIWAHTETSASAEEIV